MNEDNKNSKVGDLSSPADNKEPSQSTFDVYVEDFAVGTESKIGTQKRTASTEGLQTVDSSGQTAFGDFAGSSVSHSYEGKRRPSEADNVDICNILITRLNQDGSNWQNCRNASSGGDEVDCEAYDGPNVLKIQITRSEYDTSFWRNIGTKGTASNVYPSIEDAADALRNVIREKSEKKIVTLSQRSNILLALDATETPSHVLDVVVRSFRERHGQAARSLGFRGIWVVGPFAHLTFRLDVSPRQLIDPFQAGV
jgi:hypothetical protein